MDYDISEGTATASHIGDKGPDLGEKIDKVAEGETITIGAIPGIGYKFDKWEVDPGEGVVFFPSETNSPATFIMPANNVTIKANFEPLPPNTPNLVLLPAPVAFDSVRKDYSVRPERKRVIIRNTSDDTAASVTNIELSGIDSAAFELDEENLIIGTDIAPKNGYQFFYVRPKLGLSAKASNEPYRATITVTYNGGTAATYTAENYVEFKVIETYTVTMENNTGGAASAARTGELGQIIHPVEGETITIFATPGSGDYVFQKWEIVSGNVTLPSITQNFIQFTMPAGNVVIRPVFEDITNRPAAPNLVLDPILVSFDSVTESFDSVTGDNTTPAPGPELVTIRNVGKADANISGITFALNTGNVFTLGDGITPINTITKVTAGGTGGPFLVQAKSGLSAGTYNAIISVAYDDGKTAICYVEFEVIKTYEITISDDGNGSAIASTLRAKQGTEITITATPNSGYDFKGWMISGGITLLTISPETFTMPARDVLIMALFESQTTPVNDSVDIGFNYDDTELTVTMSGSLILSLTDPSKSSITLVFTTSGYSNIEWFINGESKSMTDFCELKASDFSIGDVGMPHTVVVEIVKGGMNYNKTIDFEVEP